MAINFFDILAFIKEIITDNEKMSKFKEVVTDLKELIYDIKDVVGFFKKNE
ncbi:MAG: hypothetical protein ACI37T_05200 [Candidatus Gastranaerophilaceae bacterium]